jgi:hypothetical protein
MLEQSLGRFEDADHVFLACILGSADGNVHNGMAFN